jgi:predicted transglutaminase-like cysteine proteinase
MLWILSFRDIPAHAAPAARQVPFSGTEIHSSHIAPFLKWTGVTARMDAEKSSPGAWSDSKKRLKEMLFRVMIESVNNGVNRLPYKADILLWGVSDYWATPQEFLINGGDCEDFAIAKYAWLRLLGVTEDRLRIAIVHDRIQNMPHAVLILYIDDKAMILDNQVREIRDSHATKRYRMIYSINRTGWWLPRASKSLTVKAAIEIPSETEPASGGNAPPFSDDCTAAHLLPVCMDAIEPTAGQPGLIEIR